MAKRIKITFVSNPTPNVIIKFKTDYGAFTFLNTVNIEEDGVLIGATKEDTASNLYDFYNLVSYPIWLTDIMTISLASNIIYFDYDLADDNALSFPIINSDQSSVSIEEVDIPSTDTFDIGLVRSTLSVRIIPNVAFNVSNLNLYNWEGDINSIPAVPSYSLSKTVLQLGQSVINFDINELAKTSIQPTIANYTLSGLQPIPSGQSCWTYYDSDSYDGEDLVYNKDGAFLCVYGYGYFQELYNPTTESNVLINNNSHVHLRGYDNRVHFLTRGLTSLFVNEVEVTVTANEDLNTENIMSINLNDYDASVDSIVIDFVYEDEERTLVYSVKNECKYEVVNCVFINKYGMPQSFFFTKALKETDEIESSEYRGLISDFGVYNSTSHTYKTFNSNGRTKKSCNTDYLSENENETFRQLMLSESIWLIENGIINPVTIDKKTIEYKTSLVNKLIQYTIDFQYSFDIINQC